MTKLPPPPPPPHKVALVTYLACQLKMERSHQTHVPFITFLLTLMLHFFPLDMQRLCPTLVLLINIAPTHQSSQCLSFPLLVLFIHFFTSHREDLEEETHCTFATIWNGNMAFSQLQCSCVYFLAHWSMLHSHNVPVFIFLPIGQGPAPGSACLGCDYIRLLGQLDFNREI